MNRTIATKFLRNLLDSHNLHDWHISLATEINTPFMGMCEHSRKTIVINAHHIDTHPEPEVLDTIKHEVAHALTPNDSTHGPAWRLKAKELGANPVPCMTYGLNPIAIDAIRSGARVEVSFDEETVVVRTPKYTIHRLQDKCSTCGKVAKVKSIQELPGLIIKTFECNHVELIESKSRSHFEQLVFDGDNSCKHEWGTGKYYSYCLKCPGRRLYPFQIEGCRALERANGRFAIFDEQGLGKTIQPLAYLKYNEDAFPYLWVTKAKILYQHQKEIIRVLGLRYIPQIISTSKQRMLVNDKLKGYMISYDLFRRLDLDMIKSAGIKTIVLDECQAIKNPDSARTQAIREVVKEIPSIIPTSGTFWKNRGSEAFVALNMLDPKMFWSFADFKRRHVQYIIDPQTGKEREGGFKNPEKFREMISHIAIRRTRKEVLPDLPVVNRKKLYCEVPEHARNVYNEEVNKVKALMRDAAIDGTDGTWNVQRAVQESIMKMRQIVGLAKVPTIVDYLQEFLDETDEKIVCGVHHIKVGELIFEQMKTWCHENNEPLPIRLLGGTDMETTMHLQDEFNKGKPRLFVISTLSGGEGLNLQENCHTVLVAERQWNAANEEQLEGRFIRIGQESETVDAIYALGDKTVDTQLDLRVERKRRDFNSAMNKEGYVNEWSEESLFREMVQAIITDAA